MALHRAVDELRYRVGAPSLRGGTPPPQTEKPAERPVEEPPPQATLGDPDQLAWGALERAKEESRPRGQATLIGPMQETPIGRCGSSVATSALGGAGAKIACGPATTERERRGATSRKAGGAVLQLRGKKATGQRATRVGTGAPWPPAAPRARKQVGPRLLGGAKPFGHLQSSER